MTEDSVKLHEESKRVVYKRKTGLLYTVREENEREVVWTLVGNEIPCTTENDSYHESRVSGNSITMTQYRIYEEIGYR